VFSRALSGITDSSAATGSRFFGCEREAPFGVPVVPEVRIVARPGALGGTTSAGSPRAISASSVGSEGFPASASSCQAM
jgi:hypothetical protein